MTQALLWAFPALVRGPSRLPLPHILLSISPPAKLVARLSSLVIPRVSSHRTAAISSASFAYRRTALYPRLRAHVHEDLTKQYGPLTLNNGPQVPHLGAWAATRAAASTSKGKGEGRVTSSHEGTGRARERRKGTLYILVAYRIAPSQRMVTIVLPGPARERERWRERGEGRA